MDELDAAFAAAMRSAIAGKAWWDGLTLVPGDAHAPWRYAKGDPVVARLRALIALDVAHHKGEISNAFDRARSELQCLSGAPW